MSTSNSDTSERFILPLRSASDRRIIFCVSMAALAVVGILFLRPVKQQGLRESLFWYLKVHPESKCNVVVAGDSRVLQGVDPSSMHSVLGDKLKVVNVGFRSAALEPEYLEFTRGLFESESPKLLLLGVTANAFTPQSLVDNGFIEQKKLGSQRPYALPSWCVLLERKFQPFAVREIVSLVLGRSKAGNYETFHANGWLEADRIPRNPESAFALYRRRFNGNQVDPHAVRELVEQVRSLVDGGVQVVGFEPPIPDEMKTIEDTHSGFDRANFKQLFCEAGGVWLDLDRSRYVTVDGSHLAPESAQQLSKDLATEVQSALGWKAGGK